MKRLLTFFFVCCLFLPVIAQEKTVTGTVTGAEDNQPVIGATVQVKGTLIGVATDVDGKYQIKAPVGSTLEFRYVGMRNKEMVVGTSDVIDVQMEYDVMGIDEVIVVAYGTQAKEAKTGSVSVVNDDKIRDNPEISIDKMLTGKVAGLVVSTTSGQPGGNTEVRIRGTSTILAGSQPLYVIDGIPVMEGDQSYYTNTSNALSALNPNDIESVSVLKDAAAASIYGSRAANGVILITTKSGKAGKSRINFRVSTGIDKLANDNKYYPMTASEFLQYSRDAVKNAGLDPDDPSSGNYYYPTWLLDQPVTDWFKELTRTGKIYNSELSVEGGNEKTTHYFSGSYQSNEGVFYGVKYEEYQLRSNIDHQVNDWLKMGTHINGSYSYARDVPMQNLYYANPLFGAFMLSPFSPVYNDDGTFNLILPENGNTNPKATAVYDDNWEKQYRFIGNIYVEINLMKGLTFKTTNSLELTNGQGRRYWDPKSNYGFTKGYLQTSRTMFDQKTTSNTLTYKNFFGPHSLQAIAGEEATRFSDNYFSVISPDVDPAIPFPNTGTSAQDDADYDEEAYTLLSYFGVLYYNYNGKYYVQASLRRDGSSRFGSARRWGTFWSLGLSWNMHNESFIQDLNFINQLKLRASYGLSGNFNIGYYDQYGLYSTMEYDGVTGTAPSQPANPDLGWENNKEYNFGLDYTLFDMLSGSLDIYSRKTEDMLLNYPLSRTSGFASIRQNIGQVRNTGIEFLINANILKGKGLTWSVGLNLAHNRSEILDLGKDDQFLNPDNSRIVHKVGEKLYSFYLYDYAGVNPANGDALWWTEDGELSNKFSDARRIIAGSPEPTLTGGLTSTLSWKGITLDFGLEVKSGNKVLIEEMHYANSDGFSWLNNQANTANDYWKKPGDITRNPKPIADNPTLSSSYRNTRWMFNGSYLRLKNITLSYNLPSEITKKIKLENLKVYASAINLYTFHNVDYFDPERGVQGTGYGIYPQTKKLVIGLEVSF
jgi:TonB-linked SusC/RagA family outer membrane protein